MGMSEGRLIVQADTVAAFFINVQVKRHVVFAQGLGKHQAVLHRHGSILIGAPDKTRRRVGLDLQLAGDIFRQSTFRMWPQKIILGALVGVLSRHVNDRIAKNAQIRTRTLLVDGVTCLRIAVVKMREEHGRQVTAGGRAHDADAMRVNVPLGGIGTDHSHGTRDVLKLHRIVIIARAQAGLEYEARDAVLVQPKRIIIAFMRREMRVTAAGANQHGRTGSIARR